MSNSKHTFQYAVNGRLKAFSISIAEESTIEINFEDSKAKALVAKEDFSEALKKHFPGRDEDCDRLSKMLKRFNGLNLIEADLIRSKKMIERAGAESDDLVLESLLISAVILYNKCFSEAEDRVVLDASFLTADLKITHDEIRLLRNKYVAHADLKSKYEITHHFLIFDEQQLLLMSPFIFKYRMQGILADMASLVGPTLIEVQRQIAGSQKATETLLKAICAPKTV
jgi:hypothetical protein